VTSVHSAGGEPTAGLQRCGWSTRRWSAASLRPIRFSLARLVLETSLRLRGADGIIHNHDRREDERDLVPKGDRCTVVRITRDTECIVGSRYN
jgi:hypothetical protein